MISECSGAIGKFREKVLSINPQKTHLFKFDIHAYNMKGGSHYCAGKKANELKRHSPFSIRQENSSFNNENLTSTTMAPNDRFPKNICS